MLVLVTEELARSDTILKPAKNMDYVVQINATSFLYQKLNELHSVLYAT